MKQAGLRLISLFIFCSLVHYGYSQKIQFINNIQEYNIKEGDVSKMRVNVYSLKDENGVPRTDKLTDYISEISFDTLGNRVKEVIYDSQANFLHTNIWDYNVTNGTIGQYKLDVFNQEMSKKITQNDIKEKRVNIKHYGEGDTLLIEETWAIGASGKTINMDRTLWDKDREIISRQISRSFDIKEGQSIEYLLSQFGEGEDYAWLPNFLEEWQAARNKKTRLQKFNDNSQLEYIYDKKQDLMLGKIVTDSNGKVAQKTTFDYEFDGNGNWTKVTVYFNDKPTVIATRTFEFRVKPVVARNVKK